ncbi:hypothetical protein K458DRAFT_387974 [Lentithecium fluviatile CBS 122367]|uniref:Uncharacterized protein n=1 Tax=Lentithecium fluviatile CBS 122367 TaxID=1168545 RepID=A0A6G1J3J1_9PLEO|nr:hypothetical protein K458DRAFT_387974 [Lentithecium fluviatile CBS 122367]
MRSIIALPALIAVAAAQAESFTFATTKATTTEDNVQPTATETVSGPIETSKACGQVAQLVRRSRQDFPSIEADLAFACLKSVPIDKDAASQTITELKKMLQFQSTLSYVKDPPEGFSNEGVDLEAGLDDIKNNVDGANYDNEYDFENDIASLLVKAHDGHLSFSGMTYGGAFRWRRNRQIALMSASSDGVDAPKVWSIQDFNRTGDLGFNRSAITQIDGKDVAQFLQEESLLNAYHDPDTRYNAMFYMQPAENFGYFTNPRFYPGPSINVSFDNGTSDTYPNAALVLDSSMWSNVEDGETFYKTFVNPLTASKKLKKRSNLHKLPRHLENPREAELDRRYVPVDYPSPVVEHSAPDVALAGFFIDSSAGKVGVLMAQTFNTELNSDGREFQDVIEQYIKQAQAAQIDKHIIDLRTNGGGKILLGYDMYLQFFPSQEPQLMSRYRGHQASELIGQSLSSILTINNENGELYTSPFNYHSYLDKDNNAYTSWEDMYPPTKFKDDNFTDLLRYNLSDPWTTSSDRFSIGVTMTGYGTRSDFTTDPFKAENLIILSDGICASTCSLFTELMVQQSGVKTLAVGGRPNGGPMQPVGGTKGSLVLQSEYLGAVASYVIDNYAQSNDEAQQWMDFLPTDTFSILTADASINFQDNMRKGLESDGVPTQFLNDTASCRIWYQPEHYLNVTSLWVKAAEVAFGNNGGLDEGACITGSVTSKEAQNGQGEGSPSSGGGDGNGSADPTPSASKAAAAGLARPAQGGWTAIVVCAGVVVSSMALGASLV